jgi:hypothetical protein
MGPRRHDRRESHIQPSRCVGNLGILLKTTRSPGARTSGTGLSGFGLELGVARIEAQLKQAPDVLAGQAAFDAWARWHEGDHLDADVAIAVAPRVALGLVENPQPHAADRKLHIGR